jgi:hypothetical protein
MPSGSLQTPPQDIRSAEEAPQHKPPQDKKKKLFAQNELVSPCKKKSRVLDAKEDSDTGN